MLTLKRLFIGLILIAMASVDLVSAQEVPAPAPAPAQGPTVEDTLRRWPDPTPETLNKLEPFLAAVANYHQYEVVGLENIPAEGPALIVFTHSLATYDITLLTYKIYKQTGRVVRPLVDQLFFKIPGLGHLARALGMVKGNKEDAINMLKAGKLVAVAPGGMAEALRPTVEAYRVNWDRGEGFVNSRRSGFVEVALKGEAPVIMAACPSADKIFNIYDNPITRWAYNHLKIPVPLISGAIPIPSFIGNLPKAPKLTTVVRPPRELPSLDLENPTPENQAILGDIFVELKADMGEAILEGLRLEGKDYH